MAEFQEVVYSLARLCKKMENDALGCVGCPMNHSLYCNLSTKEFTREAIKEAEEIITRWADDHPEPEYPTWMEYLKEQGIISVECDIPLKFETLTGPVPFVKKVAAGPKFCRPIPADVAEKLGIEPKKGGKNHG